MFDWAAGIQFEIGEGGQHGIGIEEDLEVGDFELIVDDGHGRAEEFQQLASGLVTFVRAGPVGPMTPSKRHLGRT